MRGFLVCILLAVTSVAWTQEHSIATPKLLRSEELPIAVEPEALQRQFVALQSMRLDSVEYSRLGSVRRIVGDTGVVLPTRTKDLKEGERADELLQLFKDVLLASSTETLKVTRHDDVGFNANATTRSLRMSQEIHGIPVLNSFIGVNYDDATRQVSKFVANFVPDRGLDREPKINAVRAEQSVAEALNSREDPKGAQQVEILEGTHLAYFFDPSDPTPPRLVWVVRVQLAGGMQWSYYVNAITGSVIDGIPISTPLTRKVYDANGAPWQIPNQVLSQSMTLSQINASPYGARDAYDHVLVADTKLRLRFPLPSGLFPTQTRQIIRYPFAYPNAQHQISGSNDYILYGALTATTNSATGPRDITSHEYAHGIGKRTFTFGVDTFDFQGGALQEGFADIGAATVHVAENGAPTTASWRMGEGWFFAAPSAVVRSMADPADAHNSIGPGNDWFPLRPMGTSQVHHNSTILSHAYYLSIYGGLNAQWAKPYIPEITVPALDLIPSTAENRARQIFIAAFNDIDVSADPTFLTVKETAMEYANSFYGSTARTSVKKAFEALGVGYQCTSEPGTVTPSIFDLQCAGRFSINWPDIPGGDRYVVVIAPVLYGWGLGLIATDGLEATHCMAQVGQYSMLRMRACNNCGCGPWSATQYLPYSPGPCP